jgi:hypothetical protein
MENLKLTIELVPNTSWYNNLRKVMTKADWDKLRKSVYVQYNYHCAVCGTAGRMNCHEIWEYDDEKRIQYLRGFVALCDMCHHVKHIGLAHNLAEQRELNFAEVEMHFCRVNNCTPVQMDEIIQAAFDVWEQRSGNSWEIDLGEYKHLIQEKE